MLLLDIGPTSEEIQGYHAPRTNESSDLKKLPGKQVIEPKTSFSSSERIYSSLAASHLSNQIGIRKFISTPTFHLSYRVGFDVGSIFTLQSAKRKIKQLKSSAPQLPAATTVRAEKWLDCLEQVIIYGQMRWWAPLINVSPNDEIVFEWWNGEKKLVIYIEEDSADYIQVWGADIDDEMSDGQANSLEKIDDLWHWLLG
jgi:hypothetical protein